MKNPYTIDFTKNTLTMTKAFAEKANDPNSAEYMTIQRIKADNPTIKISCRTHRTPSKYHNKDGSITRNNQFKGLSVERMEHFIKALPHSEKYMDSFNFLKEQSTYANLAIWFKAQFPNYAANPLYYLKNEVEVVELPDFTGDKLSVTVLTVERSQASEDDAA